MRILLILCGLCPLWATGYTCSQSGLSNAASTWGGAGVPGDGDSITLVNGCEVQIPAGVTLVVGTNVDQNWAVAFDPPSAAKLRVYGTLRLHGIVIVGHGATLNIEAGGVLEMDPAAGTTIRVAGTGSGATFAHVTTTGTLASPATLRKKAGALGTAGYFGGSVLTEVTMANTVVSGLSDPALSGAAILAQSLNVTNVLMLGAGHVQTTASGTIDLGNFLIDGLHIRSPLTGTFGVSIALDPKGLKARTVNNLTIMSGTNTTASVYLGDANSGSITFSNCLFSSSAPSFTPAPNVTLVNVVLAPTVSDTYYSPKISIGGNANTLWDGGAAWGYPGTYSSQIVAEFDTGLASGHNTVRNVIVDMGGSTTLGHLWIGTGDHRDDHVIMTNTAGALDSAGKIGSSSQHYADHITMHSYPSSALALEEINAGALVQRQLTNNIATTMGSLVSLGGWQTPFPTFVKQSSFLFDYNWFSDGRAPCCGGLGDVIWDDVHSRRGTLVLSAIQQALGTVTVTGGSGANLTLSSTSLVSPGDWLYYAIADRAAKVLAIPVAGSVTLGKDNSGATPSFPVAATLSIMPNFWATGMYGDTGKGLHEYADPPNYVSNACTVLTWDASLGGPGTYSHAVTALYNTTGWDATGNVVTPDHRYDWQNWASYMRTCFTPLNPSLWCAGSDGETPGAVAWCAKGKALLSALSSSAL